MHTTKAPFGTTFIHNGDFSGNIFIGPNGDKQIAIPFEDLKYLVAEYVARQQIEKLENASPDQVLGILTRIEPLSKPGFAKFRLNRDLCEVAQKVDEIIEYLNNLINPLG